MIYQVQFCTAENPGFMFLPSSLWFCDTQQWDSNKSFPITHREPEMGSPWKREEDWIRI